jgi:hypothetical protein
MSELFSSTSTTTEPDPNLCPSLYQNYGQYKTAEGVFQWLQSIWKYKVDPKSFNPEIFTLDCLLTDPFANSCLHFSLISAVHTILTPSMQTSSSSIGHSRQREEKLISRLLLSTSFV